MIENFLQSRTSIIILSIVWGLGLATLFAKTCTGPNCKVSVYKGPHVPDNKDQYWRYGTQECYKVTPYVVPC